MFCVHTFLTVVSGDSRIQSKFYLFCTVYLQVGEYIIVLQIDRHFPYKVQLRVIWNRAKLRKFIIVSAIVDT